MGQKNHFQFIRALPYGRHAIWTVPNSHQGSSLTNHYNKQANKNQLDFNMKDRWEKYYGNTSIPLLCQSS